MKFRDRNVATDYVAECLGPGVEVYDRSTPSYELRKGSPNERVWEVLCRYFDIPERETFRLACEQVASGQGKESANLLTIHSSALLALLCFYKVGAGESLVIECEGCAYEFDKVFFEVENIVKNQSDRPSSIDIALYSTSHKVMLLLESKFTEPLNGANLSNVGDKYVDRLKLLSKAGIRFIEKTQKFDCVKVMVGRRERYLYYDGIKQMVAHIIGAECGPAAPADNRNGDKQERYAECFRKAEKIYLGCILFNDATFFDDAEHEMILKYITLYEESMAIIAETVEEGNKGRLRLLTRPMTYQEVFKRKNSDYHLTEKILKFYNLVADPE